MYYVNKEGKYYILDTKKLESLMNGRKKTQGKPIMTQYEDLSRIIHVDIDTVRKYRGGDRLPEEEALKKIAEYYEVTCLDILKEYIPSEKDKRKVTVCFHTTDFAWLFPVFCFGLSCLFWYIGIGAAGILGWILLYFEKKREMLQQKEERHPYHRELGGIGLVCVIFGIVYSILWGKVSVHTGTLGNFVLLEIAFVIGLGLYMLYDVYRYERGIEYGRQKD